MSALVLRGTRCAVDHEWLSSFSVLLPELAVWAVHAQHTHQHPLPSILAYLPPSNGILTLPASDCDVNTTGFIPHVTYQ